MALTITTFESASWVVTAGTITLSVTGALTGDLIVVNCGGDNASSGNVTASTISTTGGSTSAWTETEEHLAASNQAWLNQAWATVTADGTVSVQMARTQSTGKSWGGWAALCKGHLGVGVHTNQPPGSADTVSLAGITNNSAVVMLAIDWDDITETAFSPGGATQIERAAGIDIATYACYWPAEAAGTRNYGIATNSSTNLHINLIEVLSDSPSTATPPLSISPGMSWQRRFKHPQILPLVTPNAGGPVNYQQALNADLSFTSSDTVAVSKIQAAALSFTGTVTKRTATLRTATLSFTGSLATLAVHNFTQALNASLSFTSSQSRAVRSNLAGALSFTSSQTRRVGKLISAAASFTGSLPRAIKTNLAGALSFTGSTTKRTATTRSATLSFTGSIATLAVHVFTQALNATLSFTSSQTRLVRTNLAGAVSFTGSLPRRTAKGTSAAVSFTSSQTRRTATTLAGAISFAGAVTKRTGKFLGTAVLSFTGSLATLAVHFFTQALNATLSFTGSLTTHRTIVKALSASLSFTSSQTKRTGKVLVAGLSFTGSQTKRIAKTISATLGLTGLLDRFSSAQPTSGTATAAQMSVPDSTPGIATAPGAAAADGAVPAALRGSGTAPSSESGDATGPTSSAP